MGSAAGLVRFRLGAFAAAVARDLPPPFRVRAVRRQGGWAVGGRRIATVDVPLEGSELTFRAFGAERELRVDGWPAVAGAAELERALSVRHRDYFVFGRNISGTVWEVEVTPL